MCGPLERDVRWGVPVCAADGLVFTAMSVGQQSAGKEMGPFNMNIECRIG